MYCPNCGKEIPNGSANCPECDADTSVTKTNGAKLTVRAASIICYLFAILGWGVAYVFGDRQNEYLRFHLNQSLILAVAEVVIGWLANNTHGLLGLICIVLEIVLFVFWVIGIVGAIKGEKREIPFIGSFKIL